MTYQERYLKDYGEPVDLTAMCNVKATAPETFRDRLKREHPECVNEQFIGGCDGCPNNYSYEPKMFELCAGVNERACRACWDRKIPIAVDNNIYKSSDITERSCNAGINSSYSFCPNCHRQDHIDPLAKYCRYCGTRLEVEE